MSKRTEFLNGENSNDLLKGEEFLAKVLNENGIEFGDELKEKFFTYYDFLVEYNQNVNLTAIENVFDVYVKHFGDCVLGIRFLSQNSTLCDIGTGAGFPGMVIKLVRPDIKVVLIDSLRKRIDFLNLLAQKLNVTNIDIIHSRAEDVSLKNAYLNSFDYVVSRAVAKLNVLSEYCLPYVKVGGKLIAYKSFDIKDELAQSKNAISILGGGNVTTTSIQLDEQTTRNFVIVNKIKSTSNKYPRGQNKPRTNPL